MRARLQHASSHIEGFNSTRFRWRGHLLHRQLPDIRRRILPADGGRALTDEAPPITRPSSQQKLDGKHGPTVIYCGFTVVMLGIILAAFIAATTH